MVPPSESSWYFRKLVKLAGHDVDTIIPGSSFLSYIARTERERIIGGINAMVLSLSYYMVAGNRAVLVGTAGHPLALGRSAAGVTIDGVVKTLHYLHLSPGRRLKSYFLRRR